ncbi:MAG: hypothetical protein D6820_14460 [Lentisphaerae bacterium]|nr:MAG: hypothetical protein D6820_14460 [Lentisphaerota bacterium]
MKWQLFISTFFLIFLAELGDKTQLATMARAHGGKWVVFMGAALALVCSTLVAVLVGDLFARFIPQRIIDIIGGCLFLVFGVLMIFKGLKTAPDASRSETEKVPASALAAFVVHLAESFEQAAADDYRQWAEKTGNPKLKECFLLLAQAETEHLDRLRQLRQPDSQPIYSEELTQPMIPTRETLFHDISENEKDDLAENINHAIEHEMATAGFYRMLAAHALIPAVRSALEWLAEDEERHAQTLRSLLAERAEQA